MTLVAGTWTFDNGSQGLLAIGTLGADDGHGNQFFQGTLTFGASPPSNITGFWDEAGQAISFLNLPAAHASNYSGFTTFKGTLFSFPGVVEGFELVTTYTLAGTQQNGSMTAAAPSLASGATYTWAAQATVRSIIIEEKQ